MNQPQPILAVQLYTLRELMPHGMEYILQQVRDAGYQGIEIEGYGDLDFRKFQEVIAAQQLQVIGRHIRFEQLEENFDGLVSEQLELGHKILVSPSLPPEMRDTINGYKTFAAQLSFWGEKLHQAGLQLCYHNHAFELETVFDGQRGLDLIFEMCSPQHLQAEFDTYWIQRAGLDPAAYISNYKGRTPVLHIKDMTNDTEATYAEIGTGTLDWPAIFAAAESNGVEAYIVEQDECRTHPVDCIQLSYNNLIKQLAR